MAIKVIYKDENIGIVNESRLDNLIRSGRIVAFCRPNDVWTWVRVEHASTEPVGDYNEPEKDGA